MSDTIIIPFRQAPPAFIQKQASVTTTTSATNGTYTSIAFATNILDNNLGVIENTSNTQLKALVAGTFRIRYNINMTSAANNKAFEARALKGGATDLTETHTTCNTGNGANASLVHAIFVDLAVNDTIEIQVTAINATAGTSQTTSTFALELVKFN
jgi:hypothetical protein